MSIGEGRQLHGRDVTFERPMTTPPMPEPSKVDVRLVASIALVLLGLGVAVAGAAVLWGWGGFLIALGVPVLAIGVLLGQGT